MRSRWALIATARAACQRQRAAQQWAGSKQAAFAELQESTGARTASKIQAPASAVTHLPLPYLRQQPVVVLLLRRRQANAQARLHVLLLRLERILPKRVDRLPLGRRLALHMEARCDTNVAAGAPARWCWRAGAAQARRQGANRRAV